MTDLSLSVALDIIKCLHAENEHLKTKIAHWQKLIAKLKANLRRP